MLDVQRQNDSERVKIPGPQGTQTVGGPGQITTSPGEEEQLAPWEPRQPGPSPLDPWLSGPASTPTGVPPVPFPPELHEREQHTASAAAR